MHSVQSHVTDEPYFGTYIIVCSYLPFSKAAKGAQGGPQQSETFEQKHALIFLRGSGHQKSESGNRQWRGIFLPSIT